MFICYNVWFMIKLFFKNPVFMVWVAFCLTYLFFKPNMYIFYLLFMIMIPLKCNIELFATQYVYICFSTYGTFLTLSHFFYQDSSINDFNHILFLYNVRNFYFTTYISFKARYRLFVTQWINTPRKSCHYTTKGCLFTHLLPTFATK